MPARLAVKVNSEIGRTEYLLVGLVERSADGESGPALAAYPMGKGSGSVTTFSRADGFVTIGRHQEIVEAGAVIDVQLLGRELQLADLVVIGSHCVGLDYLLGELQRRGVRAKFLAVGSTAGLDAAKRGECDVAGDPPARSGDRRVQPAVPDAGARSRPRLRPAAGHRLPPGRRALRGPRRRDGDRRRQSRDPACVMVNRNQGSGTRALIDRLLARRASPPGYAMQPRNHNAVAAAVAQGRADWGVTLDTVARGAGLGFLPVQDEQYDFVVPKARRGTAGRCGVRRPARESRRRGRSARRLGMQSRG